MSTARRARWSGALVSSAGRVVLLRGTTGSVVFPDPAAGTAPTTTPVLYSDGTGVLYADATPVEYSS